MISPGSVVFLCPGDCPPNERLCRGSILHVDGGMCTVEFHHPATWPETGQQVSLHYDRGGEFTRQAAIVVTVEGPLVQLQTHGAAESVWNIPVVSHHRMLGCRRRLEASCKQSHVIFIY